mmetsp:Transcript_34629/g.73755  ORF Transcript_34629/g.73755 Transcript_34629/m.73755 type:complete len:223 (+) Transcript_34629:524-1192(+)
MLQKKNEFEPPQRRVRERRRAIFITALPPEVGWNQWKEWAGDVARPERPGIDLRRVPPAGGDADEPLVGIALGVRERKPGGDAAGLPGRIPIPRVAERVRDVCFWDDPRFNLWTQEAGVDPTVQVPVPGDHILADRKPDRPEVAVDTRQQIRGNLARGGRRARQAGGDHAAPQPVLLGGRKRRQDEQVRPRLAMHAQEGEDSEAPVDRLRRARAGPSRGWRC